MNKYGSTITEETRNDLIAAVWKALDEGDQGDVTDVIAQALESEENER